MNVFHAIKQLILNISDSIDAIPFHDRNDEYARFYALETSLILPAGIFAFASVFAFFMALGGLVELFQLKTPDAPLILLKASGCMFCVSSMLFIATNTLMRRDITFEMKQWLALYFKEQNITPKEQISTKLEFAPHLHSAYKLRLKISNIGALGEI